MGVSHPVSRNFETHIPDISSKNMANPASRKSPAGPLEVESGKSRRDIVLFVSIVVVSFYN